MNEPFETNAHHLVLGQLNDFLTGAVIADTLDERYRQKLAKKLVMDKGYDAADILSNQILEIRAGEKAGTVKVDFLVQMAGKLVILIKYAPGSLVTRRLSTLALSRLVRPYQIPLVVVTNGEDAELLDGHTGCLTAEGLAQLPAKSELETMMADIPFKSIPNGLYEKASRIAYACEIDGACPCDTDVCVMSD